jgi:CBS domain-containing protein
MDGMTRASDIMSSPPVCILPTTTVAHALEQLRTEGFRHLPVTNSAGVLLGVVSARDLGEASTTATVADAMSPEVVVGAPDDDVLALARRFVQTRVGALPIVERGVIVGIVSVVDVLQALAEKSTTGDGMRCATCGHEIDRARQRSHPWSVLCERCLDEQVYELMTRE